jgi:hypothetical protein
MLIYFAGNSFDKHHDRYYIYMTDMANRLQSFHYMKRLIEILEILKEYRENK